MTNQEEKSLKKSRRWAIQVNGKLKRVVTAVDLSVDEARKYITKYISGKQIYKVIHDPSGTINFIENLFQDTGTVVQGYSQENTKDECIESVPEQAKLLQDTKWDISQQNIAIHDKVNNTQYIIVNDREHEDVLVIANDNLKRAAENFIWQQKVKELDTSRTVRSFTLKQRTWNACLAVRSLIALYLKQANSFLWNFWKKIYQRRS